MSKKSRHRYDYNYTYNNGFSNAFVFIILVLIILQWLRSCSEGGKDTNLLNNGGLFIITLFILAACYCQSQYTVNYRHYFKRKQHYRC